MTRQTKATCVSLLLHASLAAVVLAMPRLQSPLQPPLALDFQMIPEEAPTPACSCRPQTAPQPQEKTRPERAKPVPATQSIAPNVPSPLVQESPAIPQESHAAAVAGTERAQPQRQGSASAASTGTSMMRDIAFGESFGPAFAKRTPPEYPRQAKRLGMQGKVVLRLHINEQGELKQIEVVESCGSLFEAATLEAIRASRFRPAIVNGRPVACTTILPVRFELRSELAR